MIIHRRNHAVAGVLALLGALLVAASALFDFLVVQGPTLTLDETVVLDLATGVSVEDQDVTATVLLVVAGLLALAAAALLVTRIRGLGMLWRLSALVVLVLPAFLAVAYWNLVRTGPAGLVEDEAGGVLDDVARTAAGALDSLGLVRFEPGTGLWLLTAGVGLTLLALFVPAIRSERFVPLPAPAGPRGYPPVG